MRHALAALVFVVTVRDAAAEIEIRPENRSIANAAYVLKHSWDINSSKMEILSPDRAVLSGGNDEPVLVGKFDRCTYGIKPHNSAGFKIDFSKLTGKYYYENNRIGLQIVFPGEKGSFCTFGSESNNQCVWDVKLFRGDPSRESELIASITYLLDQGCRSASAPPKPRF